MQKGYITLSDIKAARESISPHILHTPLVPCFPLSDKIGADLRLKLDFLQATGAFKLRGATNAILSLTPEERARGIVTCSTGNHGRGLAYAARLLGVRAVICMSPFVPKVKVDGIKRFGAEIRIAGQNQDEAELEALKLMRTEGLIYLSAFDHPDVIAGQGTLGLELVEDWPDMDTVVVPLSGGGLLAGIAAALKALSPDTRLIGVSMDRGPAMYNSLHAGTPVTVIEEPTLADSLSGGIGLDNRYTFRMIRDLVDETVLVSETEIAQAMRILYQEQQIIVEGGAAVGIAALLAQKICVKGRKVAAILSGRNIDMTLFQRIANGEDVDLAKNPSAGSIMK